MSRAPGALRLPLQFTVLLQPSFRHAHPPPARRRDRTRPAPSFHTLRLCAPRADLAAMEPVLVDRAEQRGCSWRRCERLLPRVAVLGRRTGGSCAFSRLQSAQMCANVPAPMGRQPTGAGVARTMDKLGHTYHLCAYGVRKLRLNCRFKRSGDCVVWACKTAPRRRNGASGGRGVV